MARLTRRGLLFAVGLTLGAVSLSACGTGASVTDARTACGFITKAIALEHRSLQPGLSKTTQTALSNAALSELLHATPYAAAATSADGSWNPLQTTLEEANRVPLRFEVPALTRLCQVANSPTPYL